MTSGPPPCKVIFVIIFNEEIVIGATPFELVKSVDNKHESHCHPLPKYQIFSKSTMVEYTRALLLLFVHASTPRNRIYICQHTNIQFSVWDSTWTPPAFMKHVMCVFTTLVCQSTCYLGIFGLSGLVVSAIDPYDSANRAVWFVYARSVFV